MNSKDEALHEEESKEHASGETNPDQRQHDRISLWRKPITWFGSLFTVVVGGVLISVLSVLANRVVSHSATQGLAGTNPPLTVVSEEPLNVGNLFNYSFSGRMILRDEQLKYIDRMLFAFLDNPSETGLAAYFSSRGGYPVIAVNTQIVVQNNESSPVRILNVSTVKSCGPALRGTLFWAPAQDAEPSVQLGFNLDIADADARVGNGLYPVRANDPLYFSRYTITIAPGKQQVLDMYTITSRYSCSFRYKLALLDGAKKRYQLIGNGAKPFYISALVNFPAYAMIYAAGAGSPAPGGAWTRVDPQKYTG